jgi:hypothetical protein
MRELRKVNPRFRVVALSATPGECLEAVCTLVNNLMIQRLELRSEQSLDLAKYTHARKIVCLCSQAECCQPAAPPCADVSVLLFFIIAYGSVHIFLIL